MPPRDREPPLLRVNTFEVLIGDRELGFSHVGPLTSETDLETPLDRPPHRFEPVILRRALTSARELYDWRRAVIGGKDDRRDVTIRQLSAPGGKIVNAWRLVKAWPRRWSGPTFDALSADVACEELELTFEDLVWLERRTD